MHSGHLPNSHQTTSNSPISACDTFSSKAAHEREKSLQKGSICHGRVALLKQARLCSTLRHIYNGKHRDTGTHTQSFPHRRKQTSAQCCKDNHARWEKEAIFNTLYTQSHKTVQKYSLRQKYMPRCIHIYTQNRAFTKEKLSKTSTMTGKILSRFMRDSRVMLCAYFCVFHTVCKTRQGDFKQPCPIQHRITVLPAPALKPLGWSMLSGTRSISH